MNRGQRRGGAVAAALGGFVLVLGAGALALPPAAAALPDRVVLSQAVPALPSGTTQLGGAPADQTLQLDVSLTGQDPSGLAQAVAAVTTPSSPDYRHYLSAAQYASAFGPSAAEVAQVSSVLRSQGLTVGQPLQGSVLLPVSGSVAAVESAFGTSVESVQAPGEDPALVNTSAPSVPAALSGSVTGVIGLNGLDQAHDQLKFGKGQQVGASPGSTGTQSPSTAPSTGGAQAHAEQEGHAAVPQACGTASAAAGQIQGGYTSTTMSNIFGLNQVFAQGRTGLGQAIAVVEFEQYQSSDVSTYMNCYGLTNPIQNVAIDGGPGGPASGLDPEAAIDVELAAVNAPSASILVYEAPNTSDADALDLFQRIASDDSARVVTTSWGNCERIVGVGDVNAESGIFRQMALQGQTMVAASGDSGSEDCFPNGSTNVDLAIDDPGSQPNVVSIGGTSLVHPAASSQVVWNNCQALGCAEQIFSANNPGVGAGGGGYSSHWPVNPGQPAVLTQGTCSTFATTGCRSVPDISFPGDPAADSVVAYWRGGWGGLGGTSIDAPTTAGYFADINQGCYATLGGVGPALYQADSNSPSDFTDVTSGNNDFTGSHGGQYAARSGYDPASGLGSPVDPNLALTLQGGDGCPSVSGISPNTGSLSGSGPITISGGGLANATAVSFGSAGNGTITARSANTVTVIPPTNTLGARCVNVAVSNPQGVSAVSSVSQYGYGGNLNCSQGYTFVASDGGIFNYGSAGFYGSMGGKPLNKPVVAMATTPTTNGYWEVASDGGIFAFGDAGFYGSMGGQPLNKPIVGITQTPDGRGYWEVASDGGIFAFGDAGFYGSMGGQRLNKPIVGIAATPDGRGYWEVASDGGIFAFGDAGFYGSMGGKPLNKPIVGIATNPNGGGYWMVATDGGIFDFGSAGFFGSAGSIHLNQPVVGMAPTPDGGGYWLVATDGGIFSYGDAQFYGSTGSLHLNAPIVGMSST